MSNEQISIRVDANIKAAAEQVFKQLGLSATDAVRMFYSQVVMHQGLPFEVRIPNAETRAALKESEHPEKLKSYTNLDELFASWKN